MKKFLFISIFFIVSISSQAQKVKYDTLLTVSAVITDTTIFRVMKLPEGRAFWIDINTLSANTDTIDVGYAIDTSSWSSYGSITGITLPVVADKTTWREFDTDKTYKSRICIRDVNFLAKLMAVRYRRVGSTSGYIVLIY